MITAKVLFHPVLNFFNSVLTLHVVVPTNIPAMTKPLKIRTLNCLARLSQALLLSEYSPFSIGKYSVQCGIFGGFY